MKVGILILSLDNCYLSADGKLPKRPKFDKALLTALCRDHKVIVGPHTRKSIPDSLLKDSEIIDWYGDYDLNLGIVTMKINPPHLLIVVRSIVNLPEGKKFDLSGYSSYFKSLHLELWIKD